MSIYIISSKLEGPLIPSIGNYFQNGKILEKFREENVEPSKIERETKLKSRITSTNRLKLKTQHK